ncbi:MAG: hypothetical protein E7391_03670 [Ruminococcaceae bacterium]|nr:hypothetical protein [Oscillospiraceae bacterium]
MKTRNKITTLIFAFVFTVISLMCWFKTPDIYSMSERRELSKKPEFSVENVLSGKFQEEFENYTTDQFPYREVFRSIKATTATYFFNKKDNNGLYLADGHLSKIEYPKNNKMIDNAIEKFDFLYNTYMKNSDVNIYLSIIPDKNYFLASKNGYLSLDYKSFINEFKDRLSYMKYIDVIPYLSIDDYYRTDSHWKQEKIGDVAYELGLKMGVNVESKYDVNTLETPFRGVYLGQAALNVKPDSIKYLTNDILNECKVTYYDTGMPKQGEMYNMEKANGKDPYEMFLSGTSALIKIDNPNANTDKELVVFRDSYGSSLVPLLVPGYKSITVVDIRYVQSNFVGNFVKFTNQDVLFMYSTTLLNNSMAFR